jgi:hypothetical protein
MVTVKGDQLVLVVGGLGAIAALLLRQYPWSIVLGVSAAAAGLRLILRARRQQYSGGANGPEISVFTAISR